MHYLINDLRKSVKSSIFIKSGRIEPEIIRYNQQCHQLELLFEKFIIHLSTSACLIILSVPSYYRNFFLEASPEWSFQLNSHESLLLR